MKHFAHSRSLIVALALTALAVSVAAQTENPGDIDRTAFERVQGLNDLNGARMALAIDEVQPLLFRDGLGGLNVRPDAPLNKISSGGRALLFASLRVVNELLDSGAFTLGKDLCLEPTDPRVLADGNWIRVYWWGYDAGLDSGRVRTLKSVAGDVARIAAYLRGWDYGSVVAFLAPYVRLHANYMELGGRPRRTARRPSRGHVGQLPRPRRHRPAVIPPPLPCPAAAGKGAVPEIATDSAATGIDGEADVIRLRGWRLSPRNVCWPS